MRRSVVKERVVVVVSSSKLRSEKHTRGHATQRRFVSARGLLQTNSISRRRATVTRRVRAPARTSAAARRRPPIATRTRSRAVTTTDRDRISVRAGWRLRDATRVRRCWTARDPDRRLPIGAGTRSSRCSASSTPCPDRRRPRAPATARRRSRAATRPTPAT